MKKIWKKYKEPSDFKLTKSSDDNYIVTDLNSIPVADIQLKDKVWITKARGKDLVPINVDNGMEISMEYGSNNQELWMQYYTYFSKGVVLLDEYNTLTDFYYDSISSFSYMISRNIPKQFHKHKSQNMERYSNEQGVIAFRRCIKILINQRNGVKPVKVLGATKYNYLHKWYVDALIPFISDIVDKEDIKFKDDDKIECLISAFNKCIQVLRNDKYR